MSYDWLGTFNRSMFDRFMAFARSQVPLIDARITHLEAEIYRIGTPIFKHDTDGTPLGYAADPADSYVGKLLATYEILGGDAFLDMDIRLIQDPVYALQGDVTQMPQQMSNGFVVSGKGMADAPSAVLMTSARGWLDDTLHYRREYLERKIRRALDYADQLQAEIDGLRIIKSDAVTEDSLEWCAAAVAGLINDGNYRGITNDNNSDPRGITAEAPYSSLDTAGATNGATPTSIQREDKGVVKPGQGAA